MTTRIKPSYEGYINSDYQNALIGTTDRLAEVGYPCFCYGCLKRLNMYTVVNDNKYCNKCRLKLDGYVPK